MPNTPATSIVVGAVVLLCACGGPPDGVESQQRPVEIPTDPVQIWNEQALSSIKAARSSDVDAARALVLTNVAMYDAVNGIDNRCGRADRQSALVAPDKSAPDEASTSAAASTAAHAVLTALFPTRAAGFDALLESELSRLGTGKRVKAGRRWGATVGARVLEARANDGSGPNEVQPPVQGVGRFPVSWGQVQYRNLRPFAIQTPAEYVSPGPPPPGSLDYAAAFGEVKLLGNAAIPDAAKQNIFQYWSLAGGTVQPPGEWVRITLNIAANRELDLSDRVRLLALVTISLADTVGPTLTSKFTHSHWRPATAIASAAEDENPNTDADPTWRPRAGGAGGTPEHTSGHSSFSAAAATVLAGFFCQDNIAFSHATDSSAGQSRSFISLSDAADEAGRSRIFGGLHFEFSNQSGLVAGRGVANEVLSRALLKKKGRTHLGACPL